MPDDFELSRRNALAALGAMGAASAGGFSLARWTAPDGTRAQAQSAATPRYVYSAKFVCGRIQPTTGRNSFATEPPVKPGNYATAINVHNLRDRPVSFDVRAAVAGIEVVDDPPRPVSGEVTRELGPNRAVEIDCPDIATDLFDGSVQGGFVKGFVRVESTERLEVVAVYTQERVLRRFEDGNGEFGDGGDAGAQQQAPIREISVGSSVDVEYVEPHRLRPGTRGPPDDAPGQGEGQGRS
jgi:hypothetical protein